MALRRASDTGAKDTTYSVLGGDHTLQVAFRAILTARAKSACAAATGCGAGARAAAGAGRRLARTVWRGLRRDLPRQGA